MSMKLVALMQNIRQHNTPYQFPQQLPSFVGMPCGEEPPLAVSSYPTWNIAIGSSHNQATAYQNSEATSTCSTVARSQSTPTGVQCDGKKPINSCNVA